MLKINFETKSKFKDLFLVDPKSDFLLILNNRIYPLHREALKQLTYFKTIIKQNCKVHVMQDLNDSCLIQTILGYCYGKNIIIDRKNSISKFLKITKLFGVEQLQNQIIQDIIKNYQEYGIFTALKVSIQYKIDFLYQKCLDELIALDFQQVIINKYDLLNSKKQIFKHVFIKHEDLRLSGVIKGLNTIQLGNIIREYQKYNQLQIQQDFIIFQTISKQKKNVLSQKDLGGLRQKKVVSSNMNLSTELSGFKKNSSKNQQFLQSKQLAKLGKLQYKEAQQLNELNKKMIKEKQLFKSQLKSLKNHLKDNKSIASTIQGLEELQQKFIELKQVDCQQNKKLQRLKTSVNDYCGKLSQSSSIKNQNSCDLQQSIRQRRNSGFLLKKLELYKL